MIEKTIIIVLCLLVAYLLRARIISIVKRMICKCVPQKYICYVRNRFQKRERVSSSMDSNSDPIFPILTTEQEKNLNDAIRITFTGDLILLKDMVENGYDSNKGQYCFDSMFEYVRGVYEEADYNIGIFEGPVAGEDKGFSTSCFDDGIPIYLNFPKEYAQAVKRAGLDLVSLANNHMLDKGIEGIYHTIDNLDEIGLTHIGAYRNEQEKSKITLVTIKNKKVAILAYTYGSNYYDTDFFFKQENRHLTRLIVSPQNEHIQEVLDTVKKDFEAVKKLSPDLIVVVPHMGKQFRHEPDEFQLYWCQVFVENGADIILSDHPHAVQPIEWRKRGDEDVLIVHCPGNFINSYTKHDGDASMIVECYLDPKTGKPFASACIPIYAYCKYGREKAENYKGVPVYKIIKDEQEFPELSIFEYNRIKEVHKLITKTALGVDIGIDNLQRKYYKFADVGYVRNKLDVFEQSKEREEGLMVNVGLEVGG